LVSPEDREKLIEQIATSAGGSSGREASRAKLDAFYVQTLGAALQQVSKELRRTRQRMLKASTAASRHQHAIVNWTKVLTIATLVYAVAAVLPLFRSSTADSRAWVLWQERPTQSRHFDLNDYTSGVFQSQRECEAVAEGKNNAEAMPRSEESRQRLPRGRWLCLPDSVDPRGAKGK
jgi:hypothetical protein